VKKKTELEWNELQAQAQQMEQIKQPLLVCLASKILLASLGFRHGGWGSSHKVHERTLKRMKTLLRQFGQVELLMQSF
jgi:glycerol dehydrogenase-like iron-containing ADH family enzyme